MALEEYKRKRNFKMTQEPVGKKYSKKGFSYVIQKHHARRLHYDFRLELDGVLKSWAVPKGPSLDPNLKRLAVEVEDHPLEYGGFEGTIPKGNYGAGKVIIWDRGHWNPIGDPKKSLKKGDLEFELDGEKLKGKWHLIRMHTRDKQPQWLLIKNKDANVSKIDITKKMPGSILSKKNYKTIKKLSIDDIDIQLAKLVEKPPAGNDWVHEIKYDGYRTLCKIERHKGEKNKNMLYTRSHLDWTKKYRSLSKELKKIKVNSAWLDGEIVSLDPQGRSDFGLLQENLKKENSKDLVYYIFDLLELNGEDLRDLSLLERKEKLKKLLSKVKSNKIFYSDHFSTPGGATLLASCKLGLEGIVSKNKNQSYVGGRNGEWLKSKCINGQEFVIGGYTLSNSRHFKSLMLGAYNKEGKLEYVGKVGTGFNNTNTPELLKRFKTLKSDKSPFAEKTPTKNVQWLVPKLLAEISFGKWTKDKILRHSSFKALRIDKPAEEVVIESSEKLNITNPDKILIPSSKIRSKISSEITKKDIADYYTKVSKLILPHIVERPLSLLRCPDGIKKECFFQKNITDKKNDPIYEHPIDYKDSSTKSVIHIDNLAGLIALTQLGVLEIHNWGTHIEHYDKPDMLVFDLDPGPGVTLADIKKAVVRLKDILDRLKLKSFLKTSGGKGFHIHVPIEPRYDWDTVKSFTKAIGQQMVDQYPKKYLVNMSKSKRHGKIFIDYLRNGFGATSIAPYSLRARETGAVSFPIDWKDLKKVKPDQFKLKDILKNLKIRKDPWANYFKVKQRITMLENKGA